MKKTNPSRFRLTIQPENRFSPFLRYFALFCVKKISKITKRTHLPKFKIPANTAISQHSLPPAPKNEPILLITPKKRARSLSILHSAFRPPHVAPKCSEGGSPFPLEPSSNST